MFLTKSKDGDYHQEMNSVVFLEWFENQLMPALKNPSLVVLDNAEHVVKIEKEYCKEKCIDRSVIEPIIIDFCDDDSDDDTG